MIKVMIMDNDEIMRKELIDRISSDDGMMVVADTTTDSNNVDKITKVRPDIVVTDVSLSGRAGAQVLLEMRFRKFETPVLGIAVRLDRHVLENTLRGAVNGYAARFGPIHEILQGIGIIASGGTFIGPALKMSSPHADEDEGDAEYKVLQKLSCRERDVLAMIANGQNTESIACQLEVSGSTIYFYRRNIANKTGLRQTADLTRFAVRMGLVANL